MSSKRPAILMGVLLVLMLGYLYQPAWQQHILSYSSIPNVKPLPGKNTVTALKIENDLSEVPAAEFDYFYTGDPAVATFTIDLAPGRAANPAGTPAPMNFYSALERGQHHVRVTLHHPGQAAQSTTTATVALVSHGQAFASERIEHVIAWPDWQTWFRNRQFARTPTDELFQRAVALIDSENDEQLNEAKVILEQIMRRDKRYAPGYIELARIAMKTNWSPEGLHQAENLLSSSLQIDSQDVNAKVLLGYVYAHQKHFSKAEALFSEAAATNTKNLWLWSDWGELLEMQGDVKGAAKKYREAINRPLGHDAYDRARREAYRKLLLMVGRTNDLDGMEALYKQRAEEFSECGCYTEYAKFLIEQRGNASAAIALTQKAIASGNDVTKAKSILGVAYYLTWANSTGDERIEALNQARVYLPEGANAFYLLATNDRTAIAVKQLIRNGENIDQVDNEKLTALALALQHRDSAAVSRLLRLGAHPDVLVGPDDMPVALIPVLYKDIAAIQVLQKSGVDYSKIRYRGMTAIDFAKRVSDDELLKTLKHADAAV